MSDTDSPSTFTKIATFLSNYTEKKFHDFFYWLGENIWNYPCRFILGGILLLIICGIGFINISEETRSFFLYIPRDGKIWTEYKFIEKNFGSIETTQLLLFSAKNRHNILETNILNNISIAYEKYYNLSINYKNKQYFYSDLCERAYPTAPFCYDRESNFLTFFEFNPLNWQNESDILAVTNNPLIPVSYWLGGIIYDENNNIIEATTLRVAYTLEGTSDEKLQEAGYKLQARFQDYWEDHQNDYPNLDILYFTDRSFDDEISRLVSADIPIFIAALVTMVVYLAFALGKLNCVEGRPLLSILAVVVMVGGLIISFGMGGALDNPYNTLVLLVPYILLGVGVDDMIILVDSVDNTINKYGRKREDQSMRPKQFAEALSHVGLSISLTSFCSVAAFIAGTFITLPGIRVFCIYAACAFTANYILQFLIFVPCLTFSQKRISKKRNICCPCFVHKNFDLLKGAEDKEIALETSTKKTHGENGTTKVASDEDKPTMSLKDALSGKSPYPIFRIPWFMKHIIIDRILGSRINRIILIILFICIFILSCVLVPYVERTSDSSRLVPDDSYVLDVFDLLDEAFDDKFLSELYIVLRNIDLSDEAHRNSTHKMLTAMENTTWAIPPTLEWLTPYENEFLPSINLSINSLTSSEFYLHLQAFANESSNAYWHDEILYDDHENPTEIKATRFILFVAQPTLVIDMWDVRKALSKIYKTYFPEHKDGFVWEYNWAFSYLSNSVTRLTISNLINATISVFLVLVFLMDIRNAFFILVTVIMIDIDLFAWMVAFDIILDSVAFAQLVMAVGLTVDYVIHTSHAIAHIKPYNISYRSRLELSMMDMGVSVIKGGWTTFLGCLALAFSSSASFRSFFELFAGIIIVALAHGIIFVPCVMGEVFEFVNRNNKHYNKSNQTKQINQSIELHNNTKTETNNETNENDQKDKSKAIDNELVNDILDEIMTHENETKETNGTTNGRLHE